MKKKDRKNGEGKFVRLGSKRKLSKSICHEMQIQHGVKNDETPKWTLNCLLFLFDLAGNRIAPIGIMNPATTREKTAFLLVIFERDSRDDDWRISRVPFFLRHPPKGILQKFASAAKKINFQKKRELHSLQQTNLTFLT